MTARRVDYLVRVSFTRAGEGPLEEAAAATMFELMKDIVASADEAVVIRHQVIEAGEAPPSSWASRLRRWLGLLVERAARPRAAIRRRVRHRR